MANHLLSELVGPLNGYNSLINFELMHDAQFTTATYDIISKVTISCTCIMCHCAAADNKSEPVYLFYFGIRCNSTNRSSNTACR